jgi:hypothetical protein
MARGSSQYRLSTCQLGLNPIYFLVDETFLALHHLALATICCGLRVKDPLHMENSEALDEAVFNVACKRSQDRGQIQIRPPVRLLNETPSKGKK